MLVLGKLPKSSSLYRAHVENYCCLSEVPGETLLSDGKRQAERSGAQFLDDGSRLAVSGLFIELGAKGAIEIAGGLGVALDRETMQFIETNKKQETNINGVYAAGDICGLPRQVAKAVGEGCIAGIEAAAYAKRLG